MRFVALNDLHAAPALQRIGELGLELEALEKRLVEASKAREAKLRKAGAAGVCTRSRRPTEVSVAMAACRGGVKNSLCRFCCSTRHKETTCKLECKQVWVLLAASAALHIGTASPDMGA